MARRPPPPPSGIPPQFVAIGVLLVAAAVVIYIVSIMKPPEKEEPPVEKVDPFAGLPPDEPPPGKGGSPFDKPAKKSSPFGDLATVRDDPVWVEATELADRAYELADEAGKALADGDHAAKKAKGKEAKELFEKAVEMTRDWEQEKGKELGFDSPDYKQIQRARSRWIKQLVALKKTIGF